MAGRQDGSTSVPRAVHDGVVFLRVPTMRLAYGSDMLAKESAHWPTGRLLRPEVE